MKLKKLICKFAAVSMITSACLTGCKTNDNDSERENEESKKVVDDADDTYHDEEKENKDDKAEDEKYVMSEEEYLKEYDARMESYIDYYDDYMYDYQNAYTAISLDRYGLPVMWVYNHTNLTDVIDGFNVQLISYEDDKSKVLGEVEFEVDGDYDLSTNINDKGIILFQVSSHSGIYIYYDEENEKLLSTELEYDTNYDEFSDSTFHVYHNIHECFGMSKEEYINNHTRIIRALNTSYLSYINRDKKEVAYIAKKEPGKKANDFYFLYSLGALDLLSRDEPLYALSEEYMADKTLRKIFKQCFETDVDKMPKEYRDEVEELMDGYDEMKEMSDDELDKFLSEKDVDRETYEATIDYFDNVGIGYMDDENADDLITFSDGTDKSDLDIEELINSNENVRWHGEGGKLFEGEVGKEYLKVVAQVRPGNGGELSMCICKMKYDADILTYNDEFIKKLEKEAQAAVKGDKTKGHVYYLNYRPEADEAWNELAKKYTQETGIDVTVVTTPYGQYETTLESEMKKDDAPTLFQVYGPVGLDKWADQCFDLSETDIYNNLTSDYYSLKKDDKVLGIAYVIESYGLITNKKLLGEAGYTVDDIKSFADLKKVAQDITAKKKAGEINFSAFTSAGMEGSSDWRFKTHLSNLPIYFEYQKDGISSTDSIKGTYLDNYRHIFDLYINNATCEGKDLSGKTGTDAENEFIKGEAVFYQNGSWEYMPIRNGEIPDEDLTMIPIYFGVGDEANQGLCTGTENYWCVNSNASDDDIAATLDFMNWCVTSEAGTSSMAYDMGFTIPFKDAAESANVFVNADKEYTAKGKKPVTWNFATMPSEMWKNDLGDKLKAYAEDPTDTNWAGVEDAFVGGWHKEWLLAREYY